MDYAVKKLKRPSLVVFLVATVAAISLAAMLLATYQQGFSALKPAPSPDHDHHGPDRS